MLKLCGWSGFLSFFMATAHAAVNLSESYKAALKRSEDLASQGELVTQAEERYSQAVGAVLPNVNFIGTYLRQDAGSTNTALSPVDQRTYKVTAQQPLFRGFREYAALKQQKILAEGQNFTRDQAALQLYQDNAGAFYQVIAAEQDLKDLQVEMDVTQKRLKEITEFKKLGRSRASEVLTVQSNIAALDAQIESAKTVIATARAVFGFMTGLDPNEVLVDQETYPTQVSPVDSYLAKIEARPDVKAAKSSVEAGDKGVTIARGGHLPSLDLYGNYYFERPGYLNDVKWDVSLGLTFPIFQGGIVSAGVTIAASQLKQAELALSKLKRSAEEQIKSFYAQVQGDLSQINKQSTLVDISNQNYQSELKDYRYGLVTNIEVLIALTTSQESKRALDRAGYQFKTDYIKLLAQVGELPTEKK